VQDSNLQPWD